MRRVKKDSSFFQKISFTTLIAVYFLILVGGIVRSTGSGMGCPDWPKCFGQLVPPTDVRELPENYREIYAGKRAKKNERFSGYLEALGFTKLADEIRNDESILIEAEFNKFKTWTEYINRLIGAIIGILIFATLVASFSYRKTRPIVFYLSVGCFLLVLFQAWIGSIVVSTNLLPWMITVHMVLAMVIMFMLIYLVYDTGKSNYQLKWNGSHNVLNLLFMAGIVVTFSQIILGTQVREAVDTVAAAFNFTNRAQWVENLGVTFLIHRSYSILILALHVYLVYYLMKNTSRRSGRFYTLSRILLLVVLIEIISGTLMAYFAIPTVLQPVHLLVALIIIGLQYYLLLHARNSVRLNPRIVSKI